MKRKTEPSRRIVVAVNPAAAFGKGRTSGHQVVDMLSRAGHQVVAIEEESYEDLEESIRASLTPDSVVVAVGGDGVVHLVANLVSELNLPIGIIPSGTGNDMARHLKIPLGSIDLAVKNFLDALSRDPRPIDLGVAIDNSGRELLFSCVFSAGFDALVNERANRMRFPRGRHRYTLALLVELAKLRPLEYRLVVDGVEEDGSFLLVAVANSQSFGGGMKVTPDASLVDGKLDVFTLDPLSRLAFLRIYPRVFKGLHVTDPRVKIRKAKTVEISGPAIVAYADGERIDRLPFSLRILPEGLLVYA